VVEELLKEVRERIAGDDFAGARILTSKLEGDVRDAVAGRTPTGAAQVLDEALDGLHALIVLAKAKRAHAEREFDQIAGQRCQLRPYDRSMLSDGRQGRGRSRALSA
jgi:hypothetical protein